MTEEPGHDVGRDGGDRAVGCSATFMNDDNAVRRDVRCHVFGLTLKGQSAQQGHDLGPKHPNSLVRFLSLPGAAVCPVPPSRHASGRFKCRLWELRSGQGFRHSRPAVSWRLSTGWNGIV
jgi:hypothetical protein